ncbi:MAG: hypothetical protein P9X24_01240, partial [Candidatus Hatepunaea meridiana]|nr:hypothetical protein [Candidatus Hatepunaea meridiana]
MTGKTLKPLIIRADASPSIGIGHVMRCLALAQAWQDNGGDVVYASVRLPTAIQERLTAESIKVLPIETDDLESDADRTVDIAKDLSAEWVVVDGYKFNFDYYRRLKSAGLRILQIDDNGGERYCAD